MDRYINTGWYLERTQPPRILFGSWLELKYNMLKVKKNTKKSFQQLIRNFWYLSLTVWCIKIYLNQNLTSGDKERMLNNLYFWTQDQWQPNHFEAHKLLVVKREMGLAGSERKAKDQLRWSYHRPAILHNGSFRTRMATLSHMGKLLAHSWIQSIVLWHPKYLGSKIAGTCAMKINEIPSWLCIANSIWANLQEVGKF